MEERVGPRESTQTVFPASGPVLTGTIEAQPVVHAATSVPVISVTHLQKRYGAFVAVEDVSFEVQEGEIFGLIGPNGAGKTTTVECLQGLRRIDGGTVRVLGLDPGTQANELRPLIGAQLQSSSLPDRIRVREALDLFAAFAPHPVEADVLMDEWGLTAQRNKAFGSLSGGQRQRLFVALAFVNAPRLVFLDELTQGLDPQARRLTWDLIQDVRAHGTTVVLVTHFMDEAEHLCDRVAIVDAGRVVALDTPQALISGMDLQTIVRFSTNAPDVQWLRDVDGVRLVERRGEEVTVTGAGAVLARCAAALVARGIVPPDLRAERPNLEDVFLAITGKSIRG